MLGITSHRKNSDCIVRVDWENLRIGLHKKGYLASPGVVLEALLDALAKGSRRKDERRPNEVQLHCQGGFEYHTDRVLLHGLTAVPAVDVCTVWDDKDMADVEIALSASLCFYRHTDHHLWFVSADNDIARIAQFLTHHPYAQHRRILVGYLDPLPPGVLKKDKKTEAIAFGETLHKGVEERTGTRVPIRLWTRWDVAAWALRTKAAVRMNDAVFAARLAGTRNRPLAPAWTAATLTNALDESDVELADDSVAFLWRERMGAPFTRADALALLRTRLAGRIGGRNVEELLDALLLASLVRMRSKELLEVPSVWREGLLHPARRIVLMLLAHGGAEKKIDAKSRHAAGFLSSGAKDVDLDDGDDSFEAAVRALGASDLITTWEADGVEYVRLKPGKAFVASITAAANKVLAALTDNVPTDDAEEAVAATGVFGADRWLRVLRDVGLAECSNDLWRVGQLAKRPPWADRPSTT